MRNLFFIAIAVFMLSGVAQAEKLVVTVFTMHTPPGETNAERQEFAEGSALPRVPTGEETGDDGTTPNQANQTLVAVEIQLDDGNPTTNTNEVTVNLICGTTTADSKKAIASGPSKDDTTDTTGTAVLRFHIKQAYGEAGDSCRFEASVDDTNVSDVTFPFVLGCLEAPCLAARGGAITAGTPFTLENLSYEVPPDNPPNDYVDPNKLAFGEVRLNNCTAANDPELFIETGTGIERAYPVITGSTASHGVASFRIDGGGWGVVNNLFFIGSGAGCAFTAYREAIIGGNNFTTSCNLNLASTAAVTISSNKIMVALGAKPSNADNAVTVYVSANGGYAWNAWVDGNIAAAWGTTAQDSGIAANSDNTKNRALVKVTHTDGSVCWNVINGK